MKKFKFTNFIIILIILASLVFIYNLAGSVFDSRVNDMLIKFAAGKKKADSSRIVLIAADDKSLDKFSFPPARDKFAQIFDFLENKAGAKAVIFNNLVVFPDTYNEESDKIFFNSIHESRNLINSYILLNSDIVSDTLPAEYSNVLTEKSNVIIKDKRREKTDFSYAGVIKMPKEFLLNVKYLAASNLPLDKDGYIRAYMPAVMYNGGFYPSIALSAYALYTGENEFILKDGYLCTIDDCRTLKMPVSFKKVKDSAGSETYAMLSYYDWRPPVSRYYTHKTFSAADVLDSKIPPEEFKDKIVIIGLNAPDNKRQKTHSTPVLENHADIDIHSVMIDNMLDNSFKTAGGKNYAPLLTIFFCFLILRGFKSFKLNFVFTSVLAVLYFIYCLYEYILGIYAAPVSPVITMYSAAVLKSLYSAVSADKTAERIKHALGRYVSKDVMAKVISNLDKLRLGGTRTAATIFFADIRNFTKIAEELPPNEVTSILNEYFSVIEPVIAKYHGIVNKYIGDGLLAVFGEPVKTKDHALNAVLCGLEILENLKLLKEKFKNENKPVINIGIGVNTGEVFAGNIGTEERLEYTVIGDNVNLASRIEAYNQILKTQFLISEYTYEYVKDAVDVVKLSGISIKGKSKPIDIYEVLRLKNEQR